MLGSVTVTKQMRKKAITEDAKVLHLPWRSEVESRKDYEPST